MKRLIFAAIALSLTPSAEAQILRRLFGGGRQSFQSCYQQPAYYQPTYYQQQAYYPTYQAVAAVPLATVPVAVDLQQYIYAVNSTAFQSFREYQASKATQPEATPVATATQSAPVSAGLNAGEGLTGPAVLKARCASCHTSGKIPRFFDTNGNLLAGAPIHEMLERITNDDPAQRMPPKGQLPTREAMAVLNYAASGLQPATERVAAVEPTKPTNPFE